MAKCYIIIHDVPLAQSFNHVAVKEDVNLPSITAIAILTKVMLLVNFLPEQKLRNGSIGIVKAFLYKDKHGPEGGPLGSKVQPAYVIVDFPSCEIPTEMSQNSTVREKHRQSKESIKVCPTYA